MDPLTVRARRCSRGAYRLPIKAMILSVLLEDNGLGRVLLCLLRFYTSEEPLITAENSPCVKGFRDVYVNIPAVAVDNNRPKPAGIWVVVTLFSMMQTSVLWSVIYTV
jgi:hypothetical protein